MPFSFTAKQRPTITWLLPGLSLLVLMILLGLIPELIAAAQFDGFHGLLAVALIYGAGQVVASFYLTPYLVRKPRASHLPALIFALLAFGQLFGFVDVLLALLASAILSVALMHLRLNYPKSSSYNQS